MTLVMPVPFSNSSFLQSLEIYRMTRCIDRPLLYAVSHEAHHSAARGPRLLVEAVLAALLPPGLLPGRCRVVQEVRDGVLPSLALAPGPSQAGVNQFVIFFDFFILVVVLLVPAKRVDREDGHFRQRYPGVAVRRREQQLPTLFPTTQTTRQPTRTSVVYRRPLGDEVDLGFVGVDVEVDVDVVGGKDVVVFVEVTTVLLDVGCFAVGRNEHGLFERADRDREDAVDLLTVDEELGVDQRAAVMVTAATLKNMLLLIIL